MKYLSPFVFLLLLAACNNDKEVSPYEQVLSQPPYADLTDSIRKEPGRDELWFRRAVLLNGNDLPEPALADFQKAWSISKQEPYALGISTLLLEKKPDSATVFLEQALKELPNSFLLQLSLARSYDLQNKTGEALAISDKILQKNPQQVDVLKLKADLLSKKNMTAEAIALLEKAYQLTSYDPELNYELAYKYAETKNPKVIALSDSLIKKDSLGQFAEPYYYKGLYYANTNDAGKAIAQFDEAISHNYSFLNAYIEKGRVLLDGKKYAEALKTFQLANTISATFPDAYYWMGRAQEAMGQKAEAKLNYQRAYGLDKSFTEAKEAADKL